MGFLLAGEFKYILKIYACTPHDPVTQYGSIQFIKFYPANTNLLL